MQCLVGFAGCCLTCVPAAREAMQQQQVALQHRPHVAEHLIGRGIAVSATSSIVQMFASTAFSSASSSRCLAAAAVTSTGCQVYSETASTDVYAAAAAAAVMSTTCRLLTMATTPRALTRSLRRQLTSWQWTQVT
jgi:hypothetical protein